MEKVGERLRDGNILLLTRYREGDREAGERLVEINSPLVYSIAQRFLGRGTDRDELVEIGMMGLVKAMNTFDFSRECAFSTYAVPLIFGEIRRFLRDDGMIKVSRETKRLAASLAREKERRSILGESVSVSSLAEAVGCTPEEAAAALHSATPIRSLDEAAFDDENSETLGATVSDEEEGRRVFDSMAVRFAIEKLPPTHQRLVALRYFRDLSQAETARILGLTQVKISRLEKKILESLREELS